MPFTLKSWARYEKLKQLTPYLSWSVGFVRGGVVFFFQSAITGNSHLVQQTDVQTHGRVE